MKWNVPDTNKGKSQDESRVTYKGICERGRERETSFCVPFSEGNQCMRTPRFMTAGISLNKSGVVTCKSSIIWLKQ
jgi:hypothetical protein